MIYLAGKCLCFVVKAVKVIKCKCLLFTLCGVKLKWGKQPNFQSPSFFHHRIRKEGSFKNDRKKTKSYDNSHTRQHLHTNIDFEEHLVMDNFFHGSVQGLVVQWLQSKSSDLIQCILYIIRYVFLLICTLLTHPKGIQSQFFDFYQVRKRHLALF